MPGDPGRLDWTERNGHDVDRSVGSVLDEEFALCLTHDVDRPFKRAHQSLYFALRERDPHHLTSLLPGRNPYWQFDEIMALEEELGVRSAFYFLDAPPLWAAPVRQWVRPGRIVEHLGRYDVTRPAIARVIRRLEEGGWEVGLHGSMESATDPERLATELRTVESTLEGPVVGGRQHHLELVVPDTLEALADAGLAYDSSFGSSTDYGFQAGDGPAHPVPDGPVELPLTAMETALPDPGESFDEAWRACRRLVETARERGGVVTVLWHVRYFSEADFPGYRRLYRKLVRYALDEGAWVGPPRDLLARLGAEGIPREPPGASSTA